MIQFILHILSIIIAAFAVGLILVWVQNKFSKRPDYRMTYEFKVFTLVTISTYSDEIRLEEAQEKWKKLNALGAEGWEIVGIGEQNYRGQEIFLQRLTIHTS